jgi:hypothetical protein
MTEGTDARCASKNAPKRASLEKISLVSSPRYASQEEIILVSWLNAGPSDPQREKIASILERAKSNRNLPLTFDDVQTRARFASTPTGLRVFFGLQCENLDWPGMAIDIISLLRTDGRLSRIRRCAYPECRQWIIGGKYCRKIPGKTSCSQQHYADSPKGRKSASERQKRYRALHAPAPSSG